MSFFCQYCVLFDGVCVWKWKKDQYQTKIKYTEGIHGWILYVAVAEIRLTHQ